MTDAKPKRAGRHSRPLTRKQKVFAVITSSVVVALVGGAIVSDGWSRLADRILASEPSAKVAPYPTDIVWKPETSGGCIVPGEPDEIGRPPTGNNGDDTQKWCLSNKGVQASTSATALAVTAPNGVVNITGLNVIVDSKSAPTSGSWVGPMGGGDFYKRAFTVDFDTDPPEQGEAEGDESGPWKFPISLGADDTLVATIVAHTSDSTVAWHVEITYVNPADGSPHVVEFDNHGKPFMVSATTAVHHSWEWHRTGGGSDMSASTWVDGPPPIAFGGG